MNNNRRIGWVIVLVFLASCQSSRFMQDDMYFNQTDAIREVREYENARIQTKLNKNPTEDTDEGLVATNEDYYDYSYSSRLRRFNSNDNTWGYYDPYYTNYYWYNKSNTGYFGNSVYSTYTWWGPNFSNNYNSHYWGLNSFNSTSKGWVNPWKLTRTGGKTPYNKYAINGWNNARINNGNLWNTGLGFTGMYYNSFDNNCYSWYKRPVHNFSALMQKNGIEKDVTQRPDINYTAIRSTQLANNTIDSTANNNETNKNVENTNTSDSNNDNNNTTRTTSTNNTNSVKTNSNNSTTTNTNTNSTTKRYDNHNTDLNITPNNNKSEENTSRSGVYSEGSRNNNYVYKGSAITTNKGTTQNKEKDPKK